MQNANRKKWSLTPKNPVGYDTCCMDAKEGLTQRSLAWIPVVLLSVLPLVFIPFTQEYYETSKWLILVAGALVVLGIWCVQSVMKKTYTLVLSPAVALMSAGAIVSSVSLIVSSTNRLEALVSPLGPLTWAAMVILLLVGRVSQETRHKEALQWLLLVSAAIASLVAIYQTLGLGSFVLRNIPFLADSLWTPLGSSTALVAYLAIALPLALQEVATGIKEKNEVNAIVGGLVSVVLLAGLGVTLYRLIPVLPGALLPYGVGWVIAVETLKNARQALFGVGTENFVSAFTAGRQMALNMTAVWNVRFTTSSSVALHFIAVWGLSGAVVLVLFIKQLFPFNPLVLRSWRLGTDFGYKLSRLVAILALLVIPPHLSILCVIAALIVLTETPTRYHHTWHIPDRAQWINTVCTVLTVIVVLASGYGIGRVYAAEMVYYQSLKAAQSNNGTQTYNLQLRALALNPTSVRFRLAFSQTNMALANSLAAQNVKQATGSGTLSDQDRQLVTMFIQQAIQEAKTAVTLSPTNVTSWENLAGIYIRLTQVAAGADTWAVATYLQAVRLDPTNPILRVSLGGAYSAIKDYDSAILQYKAASAMKTDYANAYYNLAYAYLQKGDIPGALDAFDLALQRLATGSSDWSKVNKEIMQIKDQVRPSPTPIPSESLQVPQTNQTIIGPQLELSGESAPNVATTPGNTQQ